MKCKYYYNCMYVDEQAPVCNSDAEAENDCNEYKFDDVPIVEYKTGKVYQRR